MLTMLTGLSKLKDLRLYLGIFVSNLEDVETVLDKVFKQAEGMKNMRSVTILVNCVQYTHNPSK